MFLTKNPENGRGCGSRDSGALYLCTGVSIFGRPITDFIQDPMPIWEGGWSRGYKILPRGNGSGVNDIVIFVGRGEGNTEVPLYPFFWDFIREAELYGVSRKVDKSMPIEKLTPGKSCMLLVHAKAVPQFDYELSPTLYNYKYSPHCKNPKHEPDYRPELIPERHQDNSFCTFCLSSLAGVIHNKEIHPVGKDNNDVGYYRIYGPSYSYDCPFPSMPDLICEDQKYLERLEWKPGIFMIVPLTHIEARDRLNKITTERIQRAGYSVHVLDY